MLSRSSPEISTSNAVRLPPAATSPKNNSFSPGIGPICSRHRAEICGAVRVRISDLINSTLTSPMFEPDTIFDELFGPPEKGWAPMVRIT